MKRVCLALLAAIFLCLSVAAAGEESVTLTDLSVACTVDETGTARIAATAQLSVTGSVTELSIPLEENASHWDVTGHKAKKSDDGQLVIQNKDGFVGTQQLSWQYQLPGKVSDQENGQRFQLSLIPAGWIWGAEKCSFSVTLPKEFEAEPTFSSGYYGEEVEANLKLKKEGAQITGSYTQSLMDHEALEMTLTLPAGYFTPKRAGGGAGWVADVLLLLLLAAAVVFWVQKLRQGRLEVHAQMLPPVGIAAGELSCFYTGRDPSLSLLVMSWASHGYLHVVRTAKDQLVLRRNMAMGNERRRHEAAIFTRLFGSESVVSARGGQFAQVEQMTRQRLGRFWGRKTLDKNGGNPFLLNLICAVAGTIVAVQISGSFSGAAKWLAIPALMILGFGCGVSAAELGKELAVRRWKAVAIRAGAVLIFAVAARLTGCRLSLLLALLLFGFTAWATRYGGRRNGPGRDVLCQVLGYRRFLLHASDHQLGWMLRKDPQYFYKMLPFAESLGLGRRFARSFGDRELDSCDYFSFPGGPVTAEEFYEIFHRAVEEMENAK